MHNFTQADVVFFLAKICKMSNFSILQNYTQADVVALKCILCNRQLNTNQDEAKLNYLPPLKTREILVFFLFSRQKIAIPLSE